MMHVDVEVLLNDELKSDIGDYKTIGDLFTDCRISLEFCHEAA